MPNYSYLNGFPLDFSPSVGITAGNLLDVTSSEQRERWEKVIDSWNQFGHAQLIFREWIFFTCSLFLISHLHSRNYFLLPCLPGFVFWEFASNCLKAKQSAIFFGEPLTFSYHSGNEWLQNGKRDQRLLLATGQVQIWKNVSSILLCLCAVGDTVHSD